MLHAAAVNLIVVIIFAELLVCLARFIHGHGKGMGQAVGPSRDMIVSVRFEQTLLH